MVKFYALDSSFIHDAEPKDGFVIDMVRASDYVELEKRLAELEKQRDEWERKAISNFEECARMDEQLRNLVAENAALKSAAEFSTAPDMWIEQADGMLDYRYHEWYVDVLKAAMETPNTNAAIAEIGAKAVDVAIERLIEKFSSTGRIGVPVMVLESFAKELRGGGV